MNFKEEFLSFVLGCKVRFFKCLNDLKGATVPVRVGDSPLSLNNKGQELK